MDDRGRRKCRTRTGKVTRWSVRDQCHYDELQPDEWDAPDGVMS
jgi:hypothetical protein